MQRDENGRRWLAAYMHQPPRQRPADPDTTCPDHPDVRLVRVLGRRWMCPTCCARDDAT